MATSPERALVRRVHPWLPDNEPKENEMNNCKPMAAATVLMLAVSACSSITVRTAVSPDANLNALHTFSVMPVPQPRDQRPASESDPMLVNSISNRSLRDDLVQGFESRGYVMNASNPDFAVAYYASTKEKLDLATWDYGYDWSPRWWGGWGAWGPEQTTVTQYTEGSVVVDVVDPKTKELLWRGQGVANVSDDIQAYQQEVEKTVTAILAKFPPAVQGAAAAGQVSSNTAQK
jgi:hypothetical protein